MSPPLSRPTTTSRPDWRPWLTTVCAVLVALLLVASPLLGADAWARVGGGQSYSGGSSGGGYSGGGGGGGYSGGGSSGGLIQLLLWLIIQHPAVGIPLTIIVVVIAIFNKSQHGGQTFRSGQRPQRKSAAPKLMAVDLSPVVADDPNFSEPLFIDFAQLVYARVQRARGDGDMAPLRPLVADKLCAALTTQRRGLEEVRDVIFGSTAITGVQVTGQRLRIVLTLETNVTERRDGKDQQLLRIERWTFGRTRGVLSPSPERMRSLGCPSCGSTLEPGSDGRCPSCETVRTGGASQWLVDELTVLSSRALGPLELQLGGGGVEAGTRNPTRYHPQLSAQARALAARHPGFSWTDFNQTVEAVFKKLQQSWSQQTWELARPLETDALFQTHRFWIERYKRYGLVNKLDQVQVKQVEPAKITTDAWFESITVRVYASMLDWTERTADGKVMGGSKKSARTFSEYWTFIRRIGGKAPPDGGGWQVDNCPSCGAPLDNVNQAGVCGYCEAKITTGDFDWVLTRIEQDEAYRG